MAVAPACGCGAKTHSPSPGRLVKHHIQPRSWGGPNTPENKVGLTDGCHALTHILLDLLRRGVPISAAIQRHFNAGHKALANQGYAAWIAAGSPPISESPNEWKSWWEQPLNLDDVA